MMILEQFFNSPMFWVVIIVSSFWIIPLIIVVIKYSQGFPTYASLGQFGISKIAKFGVTASGLAMAKMFEDQVYSFLVQLTGGELSFFGLLGKTLVVILFTSFVIMFLKWYIGRLEKRGRDKDTRQKEGEAILHSPSFPPRIV